MIIEFFQTCSDQTGSYEKGYPTSRERWASDFYFLTPKSTPKNYLGCNYNDCKNVWELSGTYTKVSTTP